LPSPRHLRIFYASDNTPNPWFKGVKSNLWRANLFDTLVEMGHDMVEFEYDLTHVFPISIRPSLNRRHLSRPVDRGFPRRC